MFPLGHRYLANRKARRQIAAFERRDSTTTIVVVGSSRQKCIDVFVTNSTRRCCIFVKDSTGHLRFLNFNVLGILLLPRHRHCFQGLLGKCSSFLFAQVFVLVFVFTVAVVPPIRRGIHSSRSRKHCRFDRRKLFLFAQSLLLLSTPSLVIGKHFAQNFLHQRLLLYGGSIVSNGVDVFDVDVEFVQLGLEAFAFIFPVEFLFQAFLDEAFGFGGVPCFRVSEFLQF
mmetsp:Transcript_17117/g.35343  ORF Transcript_17117/g.35343 Transcript_17117/m.35343 type:complete len:227 (-) Transcript_17117:680-1360(-)